MSTFPGTIQELPGIGIDRFNQPVREQATIFFLSHCHYDHMQGLQDADPLPGPLYVSPHTAVIVGLRYKQHRVVEMAVREQLSLTVRPPEGPAYELSVRTVPAEHCPGSVMFYFETKTVRLLYTGDFRLSPESLSVIEQDRVRPTIIYLDSTFLDREYAYFPTRQTSMDKIVALCSDWLAKNRLNVISLSLPASYGSEELLYQLSSRLGQRIHVYASQRGPYKHFALLDGVFTDDAAGARIHACQGVTLQHETPCWLAKEHVDTDGFVMTVRPSARRWTNLRSDEPFWKKGRRNYWYVCYSSHASSSELVDFIHRLQPEAQDIRFNVVKNAADWTQKETYLQSLLQPHGEGKETLAREATEMQTLLLPSGNFKPNDKDMIYTQIYSDSESDVDQDEPLMKLPRRVPFQP